MKPKFQLVGGCATSFVSEGAKPRTLSSDNDSAAPQQSELGLAAELLEKFLLTIITAVEAKAGVVRVLSPDGLVLRTIGCVGLPADVCQSECVVDAGCGVCGKSASGHSLESSDVSFCKTQFGSDYFGDVCKFVLAVPLADDENSTDLNGVITLFFADEKNITDSLKHTVQSYADLTRIALKNIWQQEDKHQIDLLAERQAIANEIHDSLAQNLYFAKTRSSLLVDAMKSKNEILAYRCVQDIDESLDGSQKMVRELVTHFRCQMDPRGLKFALKKLVEDFKSRTKIGLQYIDSAEEFVLPKEYELQVFLIVREALVNVATHSRATQARMVVSHEGKRFKFIVEDDGDGVSAGEPAEGHYGLAIMRERALRIGGEVEVESLQGQGTRVQLVFDASEIPLVD